jgi:group I intron endonuclease
VKSGIYRIVQLSTGRHYIGSAVDVDARRRRHWWELHTGRHSNPKLQRAWNKYGADDFIHEKIETCDKKVLTEREQFWMDSTKPFFNILQRARSAQGLVMPESAKKVLSEKAKARYAALSEEEKADLHAAHAARLRGRKQTAEHSQAIAKALKGRRNNEAQNAALARNRDNPEALAKRIAARACIWYTATAPDGTVHEFQNMCEFARQHDLSQSHMVAVAKGTRRAHKGWTCSYLPAPAPSLHPSLQS